MSQLPEPTNSLSPGALKVYNKLLEKRGSVDGLYESMLNHPKALKHIGRLGTYLRFEGALPDDIREIIILYVSKKLNCGYEWIKHEPYAIKAGISEEIINKIKAGKPHSEFNNRISQAMQIADCVLNRISIPDELHNSVEKELGTKDLIELVILCGFYSLIASFTLAFDVPMPQGFEDPFK